MTSFNVEMDFKLIAVIIIIIIIRSKEYSQLIRRHSSNMLYLTLIRQMASYEQLKYRMAVQIALQIPCFCHLLFRVQYLNFVCRVLL